MHRRRENRITVSKRGVYWYWSCQAHDCPARFLGQRFGTTYSWAGAHVAAERHGHEHHRNEHLGHDLPA